jgi:hypothetical protein
MSRYSWHTNSFSMTGAIPTTPQTLSVGLPAAATLKRFQLRNTYVSMYHQNNDASHVCSPKMSIYIEYIPLFTGGQEIYQGSRRIPTEWSTMVVPPAIPVYDFQASAGDLELGLNQQCSYGKLTDPAATVRLTTYIYAYPFLNNDYSGEWDLELACLVFQ